MWFRKCNYMRKNMQYADFCKIYDHMFAYNRLSLVSTILQKVWRSPWVCCHQWAWPWGQYRGCDSWEYVVWWLVAPSFVDREAATLATQRPARRALVTSVRWGRTGSAEPLGRTHLRQTQHSASLTLLPKSCYLTRQLGRRYVNNGAR